MQRRLLTILAVLAAAAGVAFVMVLAVPSATVGTYRITVIEGLTVGQMLERLSQQTPYTVAEFSDALLDGSVTSTLHPARPDEVRDWEGLLFPDTYDVTDEDTAADILQMLADTAEARVGSVDWSLARSRGLTPYDGIVIASMIEREAGVERDRPLIASVIYNRLEIGMRLQIDATVVYALGGYPPGGLTYADLEVDSPYNTYRVDGLPPTPIAGVRLSSLQAAADPADTDYFFYVLAEPDGGHEFTTTYEEHLQAIERSREAGVLP